MLNLYTNIESEKIQKIFLLWNKMFTVDMNLGFYTAKMYRHYLKHDTHFELLTKIQTANIWSKFINVVLLEVNSINLRQKSDNVIRNVFGLKQASFEG